MSGRGSRVAMKGVLMLKKNSMAAARAVRRSPAGCSYDINKVICISRSPFLGSLSHSLPMYFGARTLCLGLLASASPPSFARARPPADSKSSKLRADIDRCLVCIPRALMANGEGTKRERKSFPLLLRFDDCRMLLLLLLLNLSSTATGGLGWRRWALARRQRRQTCRISKFLSGSSTFRKQRGGGWRVGGSNCLGKQASETRSPPPPPLQHATLGATPLLPNHEGGKM